MNAPLASLVRWRVLDCAKHSSSLRRALRQRDAMDRASNVQRGQWTSRHPAKDRLELVGFSSGMGYCKKLVASRWTIGPRGVLP